MSIEAMKQALEALESGDGWRQSDAITTLRTAIEQAEKQEPVAHAVIAGALFDFMGWLTTRKERLVLSSADNASPAVEAITEFAKMRGLSLNDAKVQDWNTSPPAQRTWVGLSEEEMYRHCPNWLSQADFKALMLHIEAKLKERNT